jgi:hypothetical protein
MAEDSIRSKAGGMHGPSEHGDAGILDGVDHDQKRDSRHRQPSPPTSRQRATSCDSMLSVGRRRQPHTCFSPLESWDDTCLINRHHVAPIFHVDDSVLIDQPRAVPTPRADDTASTHKPQAAPAAPPHLSTLIDRLIDKLHITPTSSFEDFLAVIRDSQHHTTFQRAFSREDHRLQTGQDQMNQGRKDQIEMGIIIRRTNNINIFDDANTDTHHFSKSPSPAESVSEGEKRFLHPDEYFQDLDDLGSKVLQKSMFHFYTVS